MAFHEAHFNNRFKTMGDPAEQLFDTIYPKHHKLGLNRPPFFMGGMPLALRYTPDRLLRDRTVECMGVGRDRKLKLKHEKLLALQTWMLLGPVSLFVNDSYKRQWYEADLTEWEEQIAAHAEHGTFTNDGKTYHALHVDHFPTAPKDYPT